MGDERFVLPSNDHRSRGASTTLQAHFVCFAPAWPSQLGNNGAVGNTVQRKKVFRRTAGMYRNEDSNFFLQFSVLFDYKFITQAKFNARRSVVVSVLDGANKIMFTMSKFLADQAVRPDTTTYVAACDLVFRG
mgnify:CR=1 FL=1